MWTWWCCSNRSILFLSLSFILCVLVFHCQIVLRKKRPRKWIVNYKICLALSYIFPLTENMSSMPTVKAHCRKRKLNWRDSHAIFTCLNIGQYAKLSKFIFLYHIELTRLIKVFLIVIKITGFRNLRVLSMITGQHAEKANLFDLRWIPPALF